MFSLGLCGLLHSGFHAESLLPQSGCPSRDARFACATRPRSCSSGPRSRCFSPSSPLLRLFTWACRRCLQPPDTERFFSSGHIHWHSYCLLVYIFLSDGISAMKLAGGPNQRMKLTTTAPMGWQGFLHASFLFVLPAAAYSGGRLSFSR